MTETDTWGRQAVETPDGVTRLARRAQRNSSFIMTSLGTQELRP